MNLTPSREDFLVKFIEGLEGESLTRDLSDAEGIKTVKWVPKKSISIISFEEKALKSTTVKKTLQTLQDDESVEDVIPVFMDDEGFQRLVVPGRLLIAYKPGAETTVKAHFVDNSIEILEESSFGNWVIVALQKGQTIENCIYDYNNIDQIEFCEPVYFGVDDAEQDSSGSLRWNVEEINIADAWNITTGANDIIIAVLDGMPDINHPAIKHAFKDDIPGEWVFSDNTEEKSSHSTNIISILIAKSNEIIGISPGITIVPIVVTLKSQYYHQRAEAIFYLSEILKRREVQNQKVTRVIANCSWKTSGDIEIIRGAIEKAVAAGVIFVTSAGNDNSSGPHYPSDYSKTIKGVFSVAALAPNNRKAEYSNYSNSVSISAPGGAGYPFDFDDIYCADLDSTNSYTAGTSIAAPHLAGTIALMLSVCPELGFDEANDVLAETCFPIREENPEYWALLGFGKLNAGKAVDEANKRHYSLAPQPAESPSSSNSGSHSGGSEVGPKISISMKNEYSKETFIFKSVEKIAKELRQISSDLQTGELIRVKLETKKRSTIFDCRL